jgi:hypothetical protein
VKELIDKEINAILINEDKTILHFITKSGDEYSYYTNGECCSNSWYEHFNGLNYILKNKILYVENIGVGEIKNSDYDLTQIYCINLKTEKGICSIEFRNESNGFYGGSIELLANLYRSCEYLNLNFKPIKEDF